MFNLLFGKTNTAEAMQETQRQRIIRAVDEINEVIAGLEVKPKFCFEAGTGRMWIDLPEQMPDEVPALPPVDQHHDTPLKDAA